MKMEYKYLCYITENFDCKEKDVCCKYYIKGGSCQKTERTCPHQKESILFLVNR